MLKRSLPFILFVVTVVACDKGKFETVPTIEFKNVNGTIFPTDSASSTTPDLLMTVKYTDKEGDLGGGLLTYYRTRLNIVPPDNDKADTVRSILPEFPKTPTGDIEIRVPGDFLFEDASENDTMTWSVFVQDVAGNMSDTIVSPVIVRTTN